MTNVGWIGLGAMGSPMASFVAKAGHAVTAFDIDPQKAAALAGDGVKAAATISDAAADADVLVLMVATAAAGRIGALRGRQGRRGTQTGQRCAADGHRRTSSRRGLGTAPGA